MTTASLAITWASYEAEVRGYLGVPQGSDALLERLLDIATGAADHWLSNPFEDSDGNNTLVGQVLNRILQGVLDYLYILYNLSGEQAPAPGTASIKTGDLSETYSSAATTQPPSKRALDAAKGAWSLYRCRVWR